MISLVVVLLLLASSVQFSSSRQVPEDSVQELYGVASSYSECTNIYWRKLRHPRGIALAVRSACLKDEDTFRATLNNLQCSYVTTVVSRYCSRRHTRFWAANVVCRFARKVNERCEESDDRSPLCKLAMSRMPRQWASITCERYEHYCKSSSSRLRFHVRLQCRLTEIFYSQCCGVSQTTESTTTLAPMTTTTATTTRKTTVLPTTAPPTTKPPTTPSRPSLPEVADKSSLTACLHQCIRNDVTGSLCEKTNSYPCNDLRTPASDGSYTCCHSG